MGAALARVPDVGVQPRDHQGPRTAVSYATILAIRDATRAGVTVVELGVRYRVSARTIYRYLDGDDPLRTAVRELIADADQAYGLGLTVSQTSDIAGEMVRGLRARGWIA